MFTLTVYNDQVITFNYIYTLTVRTVKCSKFNLKETLCQQ